MFDPEAFIASQDWIFAKSMPTNPHSYIVRGKGNSHADFEAFVRYIRRHAEERVWGRGRGRKIYLYWTDSVGRKYWTMGWPVAETTIINRVEPENDGSVPLKDTAGFGIRYSSPTGERPLGGL
jgi:hypothetical protein